MAVIQNGGKRQIKLKLKNIKMALIQNGGSET